VQLRDRLDERLTALEEGGAQRRRKIEAPWRESVDCPYPAACALPTGTEKEYNVPTFRLQTTASAQTMEHDRTHLNEARILELASDSGQAHSVSQLEEEHLANCSQCLGRLVQLVKTFYEVINAGH
jgi:hypothetical protein